ncbi:MAG: hypothetical protein NC251_00980 [Lachnoclostridium sp.]|nr:hypothetical protein [Lachnospira sp.]MCM1246989.1 hypothetical protein [Lachnoclostridium sp.]MCM1535042.1 hypothetical protein [Clostridium sp.]
MIEYSVKDLLHVILKKFYIVILGIIFFVCLAMYSEKTSYQRALENYERYVLVDAGENVEQAPCVSFCLVSCTSKPGVEWSNVDSAHIVYTLLADEALQKNLKLKDKIEITLIEDSNIMIWESQSLSAVEFAQQIESVKQTLKTSLVEQSINIQYGDIDSGMFASQSDFNERIMQKPDRRLSKVQIYIRGSILGILVSVISILFMDYIKRNKNTVISVKG